MNNLTLQENKKTTRDPLLDAVKFLLIVLVVFGHTLQYAGQEEYQTLNLLRSKLYLFIYTFHMPLFIFISGYLSKNITKKKFLNSLPSVVVTYLVFQIILAAPDLYWGNINYLTFIFQPIDSMWYLACLIIWRLVVCLLPKRSIGVVAILISICISFLSGFFIGDHTLARLFLFLPYFIIGFYCSPNLIKNIKNINKIYAIAFSLFIFLVLYEFAPRSLIFSLYGAEYSFFAFPDSLTGVIFRLISYLLAVVLSCSVICLTPLSFSKWGDKTLYIYLLHIVFISLFYYRLLEYFNIQTYVTMHFIVTLLLVSSIIILSRFKIIQYLIDPVNNLLRKK